jgi:hypothetical protein
VLLQFNIPPCSKNSRHGNHYSQQSHSHPLMCW